ncbi:carboxy-S-adenosyl-L-methionine synthase CmoA [Nitratifractor sp.]|uniref:carboxy-S-adenosyl-L-methionine synthase CmoA n=1 Tax=Nitratifractor sp. TaxID=2268144 RepID=UPI0025EF713E|nr:carboxy-S-adenosyl-L-methionine synthase CmoA [Nitratifractor sp.]
MSQKDRVFQEAPGKKFEFDETVAAVFDDMLNRSVPYYEEVMELIVRLILSREKEGLRILDLGTSTARLLLALHNTAASPLTLRGVDNSPAMIDRARKKCAAFGAESIELIEGDLRTFPIEGEDVVVANYTLQFIRPMDRPALVRRIYEGLNEGGEFYFSEKVVFEDRYLDKAMIDIYYDYKRRQGYSDYEISAKREALENVLIPFTIEENIRLCREAGFTHVDTIFQWANFATFRAKKL